MVILLMYIGSHCILVLILPYHFSNDISFTLEGSDGTPMGYPGLGPAAGGHRGHRRATSRRLGEDVRSYVPRVKRPHTSAVGQRTHL